MLLGARDQETLVPAHGNFEAYSSGGSLKVSESFSDGSCLPSEDAIVEIGEDKVQAIAPMSCPDVA